MSCSKRFPDIFARKENALARLDPRTLWIVAMILLLGVICANNPVLPLAVFVATGIPRRFAGFLAPLGIAMVLFVLQALLVGHTVIFSTINIIVYREGLQSGFLLVSRVLGAVGVMRLLSSAAPAHRLFLGLRALGMPHGWVEIALLMYRYIFSLRELTADLTAAQRLRLGYCGVRRGLASAGTVAGAVLLRSMDQAVRTEEAMRVRCYQGKIPLGALPPLVKRDWIIMAMTACIMAALFWMLGT